MTVKTIKKEEGILRKISDNKSVLNLLTKDDTENLSIGKIDSSNLDMDTDTENDRAYYILEGELIIDNNIGNPGDVIFVKAGSKYNMKGTFKAVLINSPAFGVKK